MFRNHRKHAFRKDSTNYPSDYNEYSSVMDGRKNTNRVLDVSFNGLKNGATAATDASTSKHALTFNGGAKISTTQSYYNGGSSYLGDGSSNCCVSIPASTDFTFGTGDITIKFKYRQSSDTNENGVLFQGETNGAHPNWNIRLMNDSGYYIDWYCYDAGAPPLFAYNWRNTYDTNWHDIVMGRKSGVLFCYKDGLPLSSFSPAGNQAADLPFYNYVLNIGRSWSTYSFNGNLQDVQIIKGEAWNTHKFYNSTLDANSSYLKAAWKFGDYGVYDCVGTNHLTNSGVTFADVGLQGYKCGTFGGSQYATITNGTFIRPGTGDFSYAMWVNLTAAGGNYGEELLIGFCDYWIGGSTGIVCGIRTTTTNGALEFFIRGVYASANWQIRVDAPCAITTGVWYHVVFLRKNGTFDIHINGVSSGSISSSVSDIGNGTSIVTIGKDYGGSYYLFNGKIQEISIYNGYGLSTIESMALYNSGKATLLELEHRRHQQRFGNDYLDSYSKYLVAGWNLDEMLGTRYDSVGWNHLTDNGGTGYVLDQTFGRVASFNGSSQWLSTPHSTMVLGANQFTLEGLLKMDSLPIKAVSAKALMGQKVAANTYTEFFIYQESNNSYQMAITQYNAGIRVFQGVVILPLDTTNWHHWAWIRNATSMLFYFDTISINISYIGGAWNTTFIDLNANWEIGRALIDNVYFNGKMCSLNYYSVGLDSTAITALYNAGKGLPLNYKNSIDNYNSTTKALYPYPTRENI